jgi:hypothetical protein
VKQYYVGHIREERLKKTRDGIQKAYDDARKRYHLGLANKWANPVERDLAIEAAGNAISVACRWNDMFPRKSRYRVVLHL